MDNLFLYKIIILYMLDRSDIYTLTGSQINDFIISRGYTNSFNVMESISELLDKEFISSTSIRNTTHYKITNTGEEALYYFENRLPNTIKQDILEFFKTEKIRLRNESQIYSDYYLNESGEYTVVFNIMERNYNVLKIELNVPVKNMAVEMCKNWSSRSTDIYSYIINKLDSSSKS